KIYLSNSGVKDAPMLHSLSHYHINRHGRPKQIALKCKTVLDGCMERNMSCGFNGRELSEEENKLRRRIAELEATIDELKAREEKHNRVEKRLATECAVTRVLAESKSPGQAVTGTLRVICECIGWRLGDFWSVDHDSDMLYYKEGWHKRSAKAEKFELASKQYTFLPGIGLPGRVLLSGKPNWILDVVKDRNFLRASIAAEVGFHSAFGFPIMLGDKILGVMEFF